MEKLDILLIEDNLNDAELAIRAIEKNNPSLQIDHISDGEDALDYLRKHGNPQQNNHRSLPKLILLDLKLPKVDGFEVLRTIRSIPETKLIPVVILSSSGEERDILECYQLGANSYLVKPVAFDQFVETVAEVGRYWLGFNLTINSKD
jgi:CheY-like chemotaxis protein